MLLARTYVTVGKWWKGTGGKRNPFSSARVCAEP